MKFKEDGKAWVKAAWEDGNARISKCIREEKLEIDARKRDRACHKEEPQAGAEVGGVS